MKAIKLIIEGRGIEELPALIKGKSNFPGLGINMNISFSA